MKYMDKNTGKLLALIAAGCIAVSGCGNTDAQPAASQPEEEQTQENGNADNEAGELLSDTEQTDAAQANDNAQNGGKEAPAADTAPAAAQDSAAVSTGLADTLPDPSEEQITGEEHSIVGIITDATPYSIAFQVPEGYTYYLTIPETGVTGNLSSITTGQIVTITYRGSLDENHAALVGISDSSLVTGIYIEEYAFAIKIINAYRSMDMKALSDLTNFPVFLETGDFSSVIDTSGEFQVIDVEKIFTKALMERIVNYNLFDLEYTDAGFVMGKGTPSITFDVDDDGILGIIGINCNPASESD